MKRLRHLFAGLAAAMAAIAAVLIPTAGSAHAESNGGIRVMPLGDSITDGLSVQGGYRIDLWQKFTAAGYKVDFVGSMSNGPSSLGDHDHEGHSGWTIAQIDTNVVNWLRTYNPHTVLLHIGTNDIYGTNPSGAPARLSTLLDHITTQSPDAEVFVATIIPLASYDVRTYNAAIPGIVQSKASAGKHVHLVNMYNALTTADLADGVHPNAGGYSKMATVWNNALLSVPGSIGTATGSTGGTTTGGTTTGGTTTGGTTTGGTTTGGTTTGGTTTGGTTTGGTGGGCAADYKVVSSWGGGLQAEVTVRNNASAALSGWTVRMTLPSGQSITSLWNGVNTGSSGAVSVKNAAYNGSLGAGASTTFGYTANAGSTATPSGISCTTP